MYAVESDNHNNVTKHKSENTLICKWGYNQTEYMLVVVMHVMIIVVILIDMWLQQYQDTFKYNDHR